MAVHTQTLEGLSHQLRRCLELCQESHQSCWRAFDHCLGQGGRYVEERPLRLLIDCAQICQTSADFMLRSSSFHERICGACAEICESCADSCGTLIDDPVIRDCAEIWRECAVLCREISVIGAA